MLEFINGVLWNHSLLCLRTNFQMQLAWITKFLHVIRVADSGFLVQAVLGGMGCWVLRHNSFSAKNMSKQRNWFPFGGADLLNPQMIITQIGQRLYFRFDKICEMYMYSNSTT